MKNKVKLSVGDALSRCKDVVNIEDDQYYKRLTMIKSQMCCKFTLRQIRVFHIMLRTFCCWFICLASRHSWNSAISK